MPLVRAIARRYSGKGEPLDNLVQVGSIGLIKAIDRFDLDRGVALHDGAPCRRSSARSSATSATAAGQMHVRARLQGVEPSQLSKLIEGAERPARPVADDRRARHGIRRRPRKKSLEALEAELRAIDRAR